MAQRSNQLADRTSLPTAQTLLTEEITRFAAEIDAFERFIGRLDAIPRQSSYANGNSIKTTIQSWFHSSEPPQNEVESAYRETILSVEHWQDAYSEDSSYESLANEFEADIIAGLTGGSTTWSSQLFDQLYTASENALEFRQQTRQVLVEEREQLVDLNGSLSVIGEELAEIERGTDTFNDRSQRLTTIQNHLDQLADEQQAYLHQRPISKLDLFTSQVYADLEINYPGLAALATARDVYDRIELRHWASIN